MEFTSVLVQGNIVSTEILGRVRAEEEKYQNPSHFGLKDKVSVRDEISIAWSAARAHWTAFNMRRDRFKDGESGLSETRNSWMIPFLRELGYEVAKAPAFIHPETQKSYPISHRDDKRNGFPIHLVGIGNSLDAPSTMGGSKLSPHVLTQEFLNNTEHTYALVSNGATLRLLRDNARVMRLNYLEFNLEKMMIEELYSDFALLFRLLHASRMPQDPEALEQSYIEYYHQESLSSGARIREKLSKAVEDSIKALANGLLLPPQNQALHTEIATGQVTIMEYYGCLFRVIYRLLYLIVIEERNLIFPTASTSETIEFRRIYQQYYSLQRLRKLAVLHRYVDGNKFDLWQGLMATFRLFENETYGSRLGIAALGSGIFAEDVLEKISDKLLPNATLLQIIRNLTYFENAQRQWVPVNYSDLDVEEFGSVYEGLLEYQPVFIKVNGHWEFSLKEGTARSSSGSHYTPGDLVKPLIAHSLDYLIAEKLKEPDPVKALLTLRVADIACGSGHILLAAARRIGFQLASLQEARASGRKEPVEQPSPSYLRAAIREVIKHCIYGVDKNPFAVEMCKVALWLEAHNPGEPLNFLDHHIKCGDAIVGLGHRDELMQGIATAAFHALPDDEKAIASAYSKRNKKECETRGQLALDFGGQIKAGWERSFANYLEFDAMPEDNPEEVHQKIQRYKTLASEGILGQLKQLADLQVAQFFIAKTTANKDSLVTDAQYFRLLNGQAVATDAMTATVNEQAITRQFFHWFLEFPEVFQRGGFDCILGNPPFLGGSKISGAFGTAYLRYLADAYAPAGAIDMAGYFFRNAYDLLRKGGFYGLISTNTIAQGSTREGGLEVILQQGGSIVHAVRSMRWPGVAAVQIAMVNLHKGAWSRSRFLEKKEVEHINAYLDDRGMSAKAFQLRENAGKSFSGPIILGSGFILEPEEAARLISINPENKAVLFPYMNGENLNNRPDQSPSRWVINFHNWSEEEAKKYLECYEIIKNNVRPERQRWERDKHGNEVVGKYELDENLVRKWWIYKDRAPSLCKILPQRSKVLLHTKVTSTHAFTYSNTDRLFSYSVLVFDTPHFPILQSNFHEHWAWAYSSTMKEDRSYSSSGSFGTFPFPQNLTQAQEQALQTIGDNYHEFRRQLMLKMQLGLTKTYNLFHAQGLRTVTETEMALEDKPFEKQFGKDALLLRKHLSKTPNTIPFNEVVENIQELRRQHVAMDHLVAAAYGWEDIDLRHDFHEVDYLPEHDRMRYTVHPDARREILQRLLTLNHRIHAEEVKVGKGASK